MPLVIRMSQTGRTNRPFFRVGVYDQRTRRDGPPVEALGWYDPKATEAEKQFSIKAERVAHWFSKGAHVSDTVKTFLRRKGIDVPKTKTARDYVTKDAARRERSAAKRGPAKPAKSAKKA